MTTSLAQMRANPTPASLPVRVIKICLDQALLAQVQRLVVEKRDLEIDAAVASAASADEGEKSGPPKRTGEGPPAPPARLAEIDAELEDVYAKMRESEGELLIRAIPGGKWQRWKDEHPVRKDNPADEEVAFGYCNATDLLHSLGEYVVSWNDEAFTPGDWDDWFMEKVAPADLRDICKEVISLHEARVDVPKSPSTSSADETSATG